MEDKYVVEMEGDIIAMNVDVLEMDLDLWMFWVCLANPAWL